MNRKKYFIVFYKIYLKGFEARGVADITSTSAYLNHKQTLIDIKVGIDKQYGTDNKICITNIIELTKTQFEHWGKKN